MKVRIPKPLTVLFMFSLSEVLLAGHSATNHSAAFSGQARYERDRERARERYRLALELARLDYLDALERELRKLEAGNPRVATYRREIERVQDIGPAMRQSRQIQVRTAKYGRGSQFSDVTDKIKIVDNRLTVWVANEHLGNPVQDKQKYLLLELEVSGKRLTMTVPQSISKARTPFSISVELRSLENRQAHGTPRDEITVKHAEWGYATTWLDVSHQIGVDGQKLTVSVDKKKLGNPVKGPLEVLELEIEHGDARIQAIVPQTVAENKYPFSILFRR